MFLRITEGIFCEECEEGELMYDPNETFKDYKQFVEDTPEINSIDDLINDALAEHLLFSCVRCGAVFKFTYKQLERKHRQNLSRRVVTMLSGREIKANIVNPAVDRSLIYCGKCDGIDGNGACQMAIYKKCKLKRLPHGF